MPAGIVYSNIKVASTAREAELRKDAKGKVRLGFVVGPKNCDPILKGTQTRDWPEHLKVKNNTGPNASGWGGQFQVDVAVPLKLKQLHPEVFVVDIIPGHQLTPQRLANNDLNFNLGYDLVNATMSGDPQHERDARDAFSSPASRLFPEWKLQDFVYRKDLYLQAAKKAQIPIIDTIVLKNGIVPSQVLAKVRAKGWDRFFIKPAYLGSFGLAGGRFVTTDCAADPTILEKYQSEEAPSHKMFLVQPYTVRPDGKVFDEVRNFFIDGQWAYAVYTDGTDDEKVHFLPEGPYLETTRQLAWRVFRVCQKVAVWRGKRFTPPLTRIDVGVLPDPARGPKAIKVFLNEVEMEAATWLVRYCPFDLVQRMCNVYPKKILELVEGLQRAGERVPSEEAVAKLRAVVSRIAREGQSAKEAGAVSGPTGRSAASKKAQGGAAKLPRAAKSAPPKQAPDAAPLKRRALAQVAAQRRG